MTRGSRVEGLVKTLTVGPTLVTDPHHPPLPQSTPSKICCAIGPRSQCVCWVAQSLHEACTKRYQLQCIYKVHTLVFSTWRLFRAQQLYLFFKFWRTHSHVLFWGPLIPLFWIYGDVFSGLQSQSGFCLIRIAETNVIWCIS